MCEGDRVGNRNRGDVNQAMDQHQNKERPEGGDKSAANNRDTADQVAESQEFFRSEIPIGKLVAEEHPDDGRNRKSVQDPCLLGGAESQAG